MIKRHRRKGGAMIRAIKENDRELYLQLAEEFYSSAAVLHSIPRAYMERTFEEFTSSDVYAEGFFICDKEEVCGYALVSKSFSQEVGGKVVWLEEIYLRENSRGKGLGKEFFAFFKEKYASARRLRLEVEPENVKAQKLYDSLDFKELGYKQMVCDKED